MLIVNVMLIVKKKRRGGQMTNELIESFKGHDCYISTGSMGATVTGEIVDIKENWIEVETRKGRQILNLDFIQLIRLK